MPWAILALVALDPPEPVLLAGAMLPVAGIVLWLLGLSLRAHRLAYERRRALDPGASWWALAE